MENSRSGKIRVQESRGATVRKAKMIFWNSRRAIYIDWEGEHVLRFLDYFYIEMLDIFAPWNLK